MAKPKNPPGSPITFADAVASTLPREPEFSSPYAKASPDSLPGVKTLPVSDPKNPYAIPFDYLEYDFHHRVYVIHRLWWACDQCKESIGKGRVKLSEDGSHRCTHTDSNEYHAQVNRFLHDGHIRQSQREETLMDGSIQVSLAWMVPRVDEKKLEEAKKKSQSMAITSEDPR